jgi:hypothetical protein
MDFLDPQKQKKHAIRIWIGYGLMAVALILATIVLLYQAYGYRINREGEIIQNGLVFVSSQPTDAQIFANGEDLDKKTDTQFSIAAGQYAFELVREGYHTWKRGITVEGGSVQRFTYPFLFPADLRADSVKSYASASVLTTQSQDNRWLMVFTASNDFDIYDLSKNPAASQQQSMPAEVLSANSTTIKWEEVQWAGDNRHILLRRTFKTDNGTNRSEYIMYDREKPAESKNLTNILGFNPSKLELFDNKYDQYYAFDKSNQTLFTASLEEPTPKVLLKKVLDFKSYGSNTVLYATNAEAPSGKSLIQLRHDEQTYTLRQTPRDTKFVLGVNSLNQDQIVAAGATSEDRVSIYNNPLDSLRDGQVAAPIQILKANNPSSVKFSKNARMVMVQNGKNFAVYDAETDRGYAYELEVSNGTSPSSATWMDGFRASVVSDNELVVFDYDGTNQHSLMSARRGFRPAFDPDYKLVYVLSPDNKLNLGHLLTEADE